MKVIRTFVAVEIAEEVRKNISEVQSALKKLAPDVKWVDPDNFHITLKFLGNVREDDLPAVCSAVEDAAAEFGPFDLSISGVGAFPNPRRARVVWVALGKGREELARMAKSVDEKLAALGFGKEEKAFKAHITIGRVKTAGNLGALARGIEEADASDLGTQRVSSVVVMQSELMRDGAVYTPLRETLLNTGTRHAELDSASTDEGMDPESSSG